MRGKHKHPMGWAEDRQRSPPANVIICVSFKQKPNELVVELCILLPETDGYFNRMARMAKWDEVRLSCNCRVGGGLIKRSARADLCGSSKRFDLIQSGYWVASRSTGMYVDRSHLKRSAFCILSKHLWTTDRPVSKCPSVQLSNPVASGSSRSINLLRRAAVNLLRQINSSASRRQITNICSRIIKWASIPFRCPFPVPIGGSSVPPPAFRWLVNCLLGLFNRFNG